MEKEGRNDNGQSKTGKGGRAYIELLDIIHYATYLILLTWNPAVDVTHCWLGSQLIQTILFIILYHTRDPGCILKPTIRTDRDNFWTPIHLIWVSGSLHKLTSWPESNKYLVERRILCMLVLIYLILLFRVKNLPFFIIWITKKWLPIYFYTVVWL